mgnify:CR=1 FL=1
MHVTAAVTCGLFVALFRTGRFGACRFDVVMRIFRQGDRFGVVAVCATLYCFAFVGAGGLLDGFGGTESMIDFCKRMLIFCTANRTYLFFQSFGSACRLYRGLKVAEVVSLGA